MDRLSLHASERKILGKKVEKLRQEGNLPAHVFGKGVESENVLLVTKDFLKIFHQAGETGLIDLKIETSAKAEGAERIRPVLIREVQYNPLSGDLIHVDFYQVNLTQKVKVPVPLVLIGEQAEAVKLGEAIVLQTLNEIEVEALPTDLVENIEVDITSLKAIDDAITVGQLNYDKSKLTLSAPEEEIVVKLAPAVTAEMEKLLEEEAAQTAAAAAETEPASAEGETAPASAEATAGKEREVPAESAASADSSGEPKEEKPKE